MRTSGSPPYDGLPGRVGVCGDCGQARSADPGRPLWEVATEPVDKPLAEVHIGTLVPARITGVGDRQQLLPPVQPHAVATSHDWYEPLVAELPEPLAGDAEQ